MAPASPQTGRDRGELLAGVWGLPWPLTLPGGVLSIPQALTSGYPPGGEYEASGPADVAEATLGTLNGMPATLAGIAFGASGQHPEQATENLAAMQHIPHLWPLTFSFGHALTGPALGAWRGDPSRWEAGQEITISG